MKIGIFDSGCGGLTVVKAIRAVCPAVDIVYIGDTGRAPYGARPPLEIKSFAAQIVRKLEALGATHIVSACNSISVHMTDLLLQELHISDEHWSDMVRSTEKHLTLLNTSRVWVVATTATIVSEVYREVFKEAYIGIPLPELAGMIEKGEDDVAVQEYLFKVLQEAKEKHSIPTHIFFGCTHYPLVSHLFSAALEDLHIQAALIDPSFFVAEDVSGLSDTSSDSWIHCYSTGSDESLRRFAKVLQLDEKIKYGRVVV